MPRLLQTIEKADCLIREGIVIEMKQVPCFLSMTMKIQNKLLKNVQIFNYRSSSDIASFVQ